MTPQTLIYDVVPEAVARALGWTLLHSLWQGALLALLLAVLLRLMHRHTAAVRYRVAWGGLMAMLTVALMTFSRLYVPEAGPLEGAAAFTAAEGGAQVTTVHLFSVQAPSRWETLVTQGQAYFEQHLPAVVLLWLVGMLLMGLRLLGGWVYVQRLRSYRVSPVPAAWTVKAQELGRQLGMTTAVKMAESALVQVPMVIGHFKPLVLLPLGTLAGLSGAQVEAILAHELAHVHRRDYLLNLLQSVMETLFFFHPAVWWMSDCIRTEREHACDDLALSICGDSLTYAYALTNLEEIMLKKNSTSPRLAVAFSGRRRSLLGRIARLVQQPAVRPSFSEGFLTSCAVVAGLLIFSASASANYTAAAQEEKTSPPALAKPPVSAAPLDSLDESEEELSLQQLDDDLVIVKNKKGKVVELYVNGRRVPKSEMGKYQDQIDRQLAAAKQGKPLRDPEELAQARRRVDASLRRLETDDYLMPPPPPAPRAPRAPMPRGERFRGEVPPVAPVPPVPPVPPVSDDKKEQKAYERSMKEYQERMKAFEARMEEFRARQEAFMAQNPGRMREHEDRMREHAHRMEEHTRRQAEHAVRMREHEVRRAEHEERMKKHEAMMKELKAALQADGFLKSADDDYEFEINKNGLFINDQKQSEALFEKYKKLMQKASGEDVDVMLQKDGANFRIRNNSRHTTR
ncbi:M56 family metallopeptidase [Rufibacter psychrotolerans]|uniref:M56 family metallopeptidase n=1 Tax=Rufibacter psychrotolerans TaxID=2812556 RepID=UPI00196802BF|nr:M56 family metallopeptidase [Rufibacter sp. SYSU D00308]